MSDDTKTKRTDETESKAKHDFMDRVKRGAKRGVVLGSASAAALSSAVASAQSGGGCGGGGPTVTVPEPGTLALLGAGLAGVAIAHHRKEKKKSRKQQSEADETTEE